MEDIIGFVPEHQRRTCDKWDRHFIEMCFLISKMSKDPSTKCGCVIVRSDKTVCSTGYNGFAKRMSDSPHLYNDREKKLSRVIHAEMNAILHSYEDLNGYTLYSTPAVSCDRCCVHAIQAGINRCVGVWPKGEFGARWAEPIKKTRSYLYEARVGYTEIDVDTWQVVTNFDPR